MSEQADYMIGFGDLIRSALDSQHEARKRISPEAFSVHEGGALIKLPVFRQAAIGADDVIAGRGREVAGVPTWLQDGQDLLSRSLIYLPVTEKEGYIPFGATLPQATVTSEAGTNPFVEGSGSELGETPYELKYVEARVSASAKVVMQSTTDMLDHLEEALQIASRRLFIGQLLAGPGGKTGDTAHFLGAQNLPLDAANISTYVQSNGVAPADILTAEDVVLDNDASPENLVWCLGRGIHTALQVAIQDPGSGERMLRLGRLFSGTRAVRSRALESTTAILFDVREAVKVPVAAENLLVVDRISKPGTIKLTMRTHVDGTWVRPSLVYRLTGI